MGAEAVGQVCLTVDATTGAPVPEAVRAIEAAGLQATFFVDPARLVAEPGLWRSLAESGHEVADGTLLAASDIDGCLPLWTQEMLLEDLEESTRLWAEILGAGEEPALGVPFGGRTLHDGSTFVPLLAPLGRPLWATDLESGVLVWPAGRPSTADVGGPGLHAVELARGPDNRLAWSEGKAADWAGWAAGLPAGAVTTFSAAWRACRHPRAVQA